MNLGCTSLLLYKVTNRQNQVPRQLCGCISVVAAQRRPRHIEARIALNIYFVIHAISAQLRHHSGLHGLLIVLYGS